MKIQYFGQKLQKLNTAQIIALGFAGVIFVGGLILWMPFCTAAGETTSFTDAMFTATTCVCVTGLVTVVTATHWTLIGKIVMLILIQIGGLGLIAIATIIFLALRKKISIRDRRIIQESYNLDQMSGLVKLVRRVVISVLGAEAVGAVFYSICFIPEFGLVKGLAQAVFTAVSAFCNAGVDLLGENSLAPYVDHVLVNLTTMGLIVVSGLGFVVWWDIWDKIKKAAKRQMPVRRIFRTLKVQSKLVLTTTAVLVLGGTVLIFLFEYSNPETLGSLSLGNKIMAAAFQSVTTRTAGFFTIDQAKFGNASVMLCLFLMFIGGSPMGTAGGMKTTTIAVTMLTVAASLRGKKDVEVFHRKIKISYIRSAVVVVCMGFMTFMVMSFLLAAVMPQAPFEDILYEVMSAVATVGLSRGLTSVLPAAGKWIIIVTMYLGRIGPLTLGTAVVVHARRRMENTSLAEEDIMIG
jgi:trk system potassium uptake protein TrkH